MFKGSLSRIQDYFRPRAEPAASEPESDSGSGANPSPQPDLSPVPELEPETLGDKPVPPSQSGNEKTDVHHNLALTPNLPPAKRGIAERPGERTARFAAVVLGKLESEVPLTDDDQRGLNAVQGLAARMGFISPAQSTLAQYKNDPFYAGAFYKATPAVHASWSAEFKRTYEAASALREYFLACTASGVPSCSTAAIATFLRPHIE